LWPKSWPLHSVGNTGLILLGQYMTPLPFMCPTSTNLCGSGPLCCMAGYLSLWLWMSSSWCHYDTALPCVTWLGLARNITSNSFFHILLLTMSSSVFWNEVSGSTTKTYLKDWDSQITKNINIFWNIFFQAFTYIHDKWYYWPSTWPVNKFPHHIFLPNMYE
jgi:hypothetical protein